MEHLASRPRNWHQPTVVSLASKALQADLAKFEETFDVLVVPPLRPSLLRLPTLQQGVGPFSGTWGYPELDKSQRRG